MNRYLLSSVAAAALALTVSGCGGSASLPQLSAAQPGSFAGDCATLASSITGLSGTVITSAATVAAGTLVNNISMPEHCQVKGKMNERVSAVDGATYYIGFEMRLPKTWNGRFFYQANGGTDGAVSNAVGALGGGPITSALSKGFAVLSSDAGHQSQTTPFFGLDPQARIDYGYNAVGQLTPMAKALITKVYGKAPDRSYLGGCSNGGRHALVAATRYGDMYDGILAGAPGYNLPKAAVAQLWGVQQYAKVATGTLATDKTASGTVVTLPQPLPDVSTAFTPTERSMIGAKIVAKCDALDGATDKWVGDVAACQQAFNVNTDIPTCTGARDGTCLTAAQKTVLIDVHSGAKNTAGAALYASFPYDAGISAAGWASWKFSNATGVGRDPGATAFIFMTPPKTTDTANFLGLPFAMGFNFDVDAPKIFSTSGIYTESAMSFMTPKDPSNLNTLRLRGGKLMIYHGTADPVFSFNDTVSWHDKVRTEFNDTSAWTKLFPVPGMGHCSGGPAADQFDMIEPLVNWVESGTAPTAVQAKARGTGTSTITALINAEVPATWSPSRTRPLCPYPQVARYNGSGDMDSASSYTCK